MSKTNPVKYTFFVLLLLYGQFIQAQKTDFLEETQKYTQSVIGSEYNNVFQTEDDKKNFKKLREFLSEKQELIGALRSAKRGYYDDSRFIATLITKVNAIEAEIGTKKLDEKITINANTITDNYRFGIGDSTYSSNVTRTVGELKEIRDRFKSIIKNLDETTNAFRTLDTNIGNVKRDIIDCQEQIDSALAPEYKQQQFRITISICFSALIGVLLSVFFYIVFKRSDNTLSKDLLSGNGLQFVTLFVLIIAIILFGILSILQSSELAAILSGISGYILGKGTQRDLATTVQVNANPPVVPDKVQT